MKKIYKIPLKEKRMNVEFKTLEKWNAMYALENSFDESQKGELSWVLKRCESD
jgi:hypothetical protein